MIDEHLRAQRDASLGLIDRLTRRGRELSLELAAAGEPARASGSARFEAAAAGVRVWQQDCAAAINELSGGSKSHWLSRAYSEALLVPQPEAGPGVDASIHDIVARIAAVLERASAALTQAGALVAASSSTAGPRRRFEFVRDRGLQPLLEQAYLDSREAFDSGRFAESLRTSCSILEAIITDALVKKGLDVRSSTFEERIALAEHEGVIRGGCARLPPVARRYRTVPDGTDGGGVEPADISGRDARLAGQVLHVIMRDLDPGR